MIYTYMLLNRDVLCVVFVVIVRGEGALLFVFMMIMMGVGS